MGTKGASFPVGQPPATGGAASSVAAAPARRSRWRPALLWLAAALVGGSLAWWLWPRPEPPPLYRTVTVGRRTIEAVVESTGRVSLQVPVELWAPARAVVEELTVSPGDRVEKGAVLARLHDRSEHMQLAAAKAELRVAQARVAEARSVRDAATEALQRTAAMRRKGLVPEAELDMARADARQAQAMWKARQSEQSRAQVAVSQAEQLVESRTIVAPSPGIVMKGIDHAGELVDPAAGPLFVLAAESDPLGIEVRIGEADIGAVAVGQRASFTVPGHADRTYHATVANIGRTPAGASEAVAYRVWLDVEPPREGLRVGMTASLSLHVGRAQDALAAPEAALRFVPERASEARPRSRVWKLEAPPGPPIAVQVETGLSDGTFTQLIPRGDTPLREGDTLIVGRMQAGARGGSGLSLTGEGR